MPMIDIYAVAGTFADHKKLAQDAATAVKTAEQVPDLPMFRKNTAAFVHELGANAISNVEGDSNYVRVQVTTNAGALTREKQIEVVKHLTALVAEAAGDPSLEQRTWVVLAEAAPGGWGLWGRIQTVVATPERRRLRWSPESVDHTVLDARRCHRRDGHRRRHDLNSSDFGWGLRRV